MKHYDAIIIGSGVAGLTAALHAPRSVKIGIVSPLSRNDSSTFWAQGGIAAAIGNDDSADLHKDDTINAGAGLCDIDVVSFITKNASSVISWLDSMNMPFDKNYKNEFLLGLEAAHSRRRIVHARGDRIGNNLSHILHSQALSRTNITFINGDVSGVEVSDQFLIRTKDQRTFSGKNLVIATGGIGGLFNATTNPKSANGSGLFLGAHLGATLSDLEFIQFHPTALDIATKQKPLLSEAIRGEGGRIINSKNEEFLYETDSRGALASRDIVARGIALEQLRGERVFMDVRHMKDFKSHFPQVNALCEGAGFSPGKDLLPITPAAHYHMGGISTTVFGETGVPGLFAVGEVACTGLHGANRLASNSLLEGLIIGREVGLRLCSHEEALTPVLPQDFENREYSPTFKSELPLELSVGIIRNRELLLKGLHHYDKLPGHEDFVKRLLHLFALKREESRGSHYRTDFPFSKKEFEYHIKTSIKFNNHHTLNNLSSVDNLYSSTNLSH